jgi:hypothetical protein
MLAIVPPSFARDHGPAAKYPWHKVEKGPPSE